jgi:ribose transport system substrate-binding protein
LKKFFYISLSCLVLTTMSVFTLSASVGATSSTGLAAAKAFVDQYLSIPTKILTTQPLAKSAPKHGLFIAITDNLTPDDVVFANGASAASKAIGWSFKSISENASDPATLQADLVSALALHPTVVSIASAPESEWGANTIANYKKAGVLIVAWADVPCKSYSNVICSVGGAQSFKLMAQLVGAWFAVNSDGHGKAVLEEIPAFQILVTFHDTLVKTIAKYCPGCSIKTVSITLPELDNGDINPTMVTALKANPGYTYMLYDGGQFADGLPAALSAAHLSNIKIAGGIVDAEGLAALRTGTEAAWIGNSITYYAYNALDVTLRWMEHMKLQTADTAVPEQVLTPTTVSKSGTVYNEPANALKGFLALWKK